MSSLNEHEPMTLAETVQHLQEVLKSRNVRMEQLHARIKALEADMEQTEHLLEEERKTSIRQLVEANARIQALEEALASEQAEDIEHLRLETAEHLECDQTLGARIKELEGANEKLRRLLGKAHRCIDEYQHPALDAAIGRALAGEGATAVTARVQAQGVELEWTKGPPGEKAKGG